MNHQDWEPVILTKKKPISVNKSNKNNKNNDDDDEIKKIKFISLNNSKLIQQARTNQNISQKDLAKKLNLDIKIIQSYECGKGVQNTQIMNKIEKFLKIRLDRNN